MAFVPDTLPEARPRRGLLSRLSRGFEAIIEGSAGAQRARFALELQALSDAELAARGLKREDIVAHAFRGMTAI